MTDPTPEVLANRLRLAHQARRAKAAQLDDVRRALCDVGAMDDDDPYSHADLADVIRQAWPQPATASEADQPAEEECCGSAPPADGTWGDCWCTLPPDHDGQCKCEPCTERHGAPGWDTDDAPEPTPCSSDTVACGDPLLHTTGPERAGERYLAQQIRAALDGPGPAGA